ncbi:MAG TPA: hypothetical protein VHV50_07725 [Actinomycetota bacterium]|jgi:hypothetical protein|nr:hypothetical protein [Actinomycetota bacterium]
MANLTAIASLATAGGTTVLAVATFVSVRSANRSARVAERALLAGLRPVLAPARLQDPEQKITWGDGHWTQLRGGLGGVESTEEVIYLSMPLRNVGSGIAVLHGWYPHPEAVVSVDDHPEPSDFRRQTRDLYVPSSDIGFWQGALRDPSENGFAQLAGRIRDRERLAVDLLYGDHEGGQRTISRFGLTPSESSPEWLCSVVRHWSLDRPDPR